jgi:hypothetical protein
VSAMAASSKRAPMRWEPLSSVMPALVAAIHVFLAGSPLKGVDGRDKPGHDSE